MNDFKALVLLNMIPSLGSVVIRRLIDLLGSPAAILSVPEKDLLKVEGMNRIKSNVIKNALTSVDFEGEIAMAKARGVDIITILDERYPKNLKNIYDPPVVLYVKGNLLESDCNSIAIVGSRRSSFYGITTAHTLSTQLSALGVTIISGLARGIDTASHKGALSVRGRTIAVLGSGFNHFYPPENKKLSEDISISGAVVTEYPFSTPPLSRNFPRRNRIISGLSRGVVVVEAARNSGALITASLALQQSREVFAVPGKMDSLVSFGTNDLIKQGAKLVSSIADIIEEVDLCIQPTQHSLEKVLSSKTEMPILDKESNRVYSLLSKDPIQLEDIISITSMKAAKLSHLLMMLELKHVIKQLPGKHFVRVQ